MALRNQPYLPLYVNDFISDEKLCQVSAESTGVYIRLMCLLHKSDTYGILLLKQSQKQNTCNKINFASVLTKQMPYEFQTVKKSLEELIDHNILLVEGDKLIQKRMVKDNEISEKRAIAGKKGGDNRFALANAKPKSIANTEYENEDEIPLIKKGIFKSFPLPEDCGDLPEITARSCIELIRFTKGLTVNMEQVRGLWPVFLISKVTGKKYYAHIEDVHSHFVNWIKDQKFEEIKLQLSNTGNHNDKLKEAFRRANMGKGTTAV